MPIKWPGLFTYFKDVKIFPINISFIIAIFVAAIFLGIYSRSNNLLIISILSLIIQGLLLSVIYFMLRNLVRKLNQAQSRLREIAVTDELTGLNNRRFIMERLNEEFHRASRSEMPLSLIILDIDYFKNINDTYGHVFGDFVLKAVAELIRTNIREYDLTGRIGGEEFIIISPDTGVENAVVLADRIRSIVKSKSISDGVARVTLTVSAGVTVMSRQDLFIKTFISRADAALCKSKNEGRDRVTAL